MKRNQPVTVEKAAATMARRQPPASRLPCLNPRCRRDCAWSATEGRPQLFCSGSCRLAWNRERKRLMRDLGVLESACLDPKARQHELRALRSQVAHIRWALERYRPSG